MGPAFFRSLSIILKNQMKRILANFLKPLSSNKVTKSFFQELYSLSLFGLYGDEWDFERNGEILFVKDVFRRLNQPLITVFDVGANVGEYSSQLLTLAGDRNIVIHAFEPSKQTFELYRKKFNESMNVIKNNVGLSDAPAELDLFRVKKSSGFASLYLDEGKKNFEERERIVLRSVDDYCEELKIPEIHFMKIDVEGHELSVLRGAVNMLQANRIKIIQFEFGARNLSSRTYFHDFYKLLAPKFTLYRIVKNGLIKVNQYDYKLEVFGRVLNYVAIDKETDWN